MQIIEDKFDEMLTNKIKFLLKTELQSCSDKPLIQKDYIEDKIVCDRDRLNKQLQSEVSFLRNEILSKNKIIEVLIADNKKIASYSRNDSSNISVTSKNDEQCGSFNNSVVADNINNWSTVRNKRNIHFKHSISKENDLLLNNRFNALVDDKIKDNHITNDCGS